MSHFGGNGGAQIERYLLFGCPLLILLNVFTIQLPQFSHIVQLQLSLV